MVGLYSAVAEEGPPAAHLFGALHIYLHDGFCLFVGGSLEEQFPLWSCDKGGAPERHSVLIANTVDGYYGQSVGYGVTALSAPANAIRRAASGYHWSQQTSTPSRPTLVWIGSKPKSPGVK